jgi:NCAIR mutase (PurE)-related protein
MEWPVVARRVCDIGVAGLGHRAIECVLRESWRAAVALFQIARLESGQGDEVAVPV